MRHVLAYLVFVGIPLAGLYGILRVGQGINAPMAIHGSYAIAPMAPSGFACYAYLLGGDDSTVTVAQSGRQVIVTLGPRGEVTLSGMLLGANLTAEGVIPLGDHSSPRRLPRRGYHPHDPSGSPGGAGQTARRNAARGRVPRVPADRLRGGALQAL